MKAQQYRHAVAVGVNAGVRASVGVAKLAVAAGPSALFLAPLGIHLVAFTGLASNLRPSRLRRLVPGLAR